MALLSSLVLPLLLQGETLVAADHPVAHEFERLELSREFFCEGATFGDLDEDGVNDLVSGPYWYRGPEFKSRHELYPPAPFDVKGYSNNFFAWILDLDGDGRNDVLFVGFPGQDASWFRNPGADGRSKHWTRHKVFDVVDNESPDWVDITGDGRPELVCQTDGRFGYASPDWSAPGKPWTFTAISEQLPIGKFTHGLGVGDLDGDGRTDVLWKDGWFEQPDSIAAGADGKAPLWTFHAYPFAARGGAQMLVDDVDGDGDNDVITSLNAHGLGLVWYEGVRRDDGSIDFVEHAIMGTRAQPDLPSPYGVRFGVHHALCLVDMDRDGDQDFVTGTRWWAHGGRDEGDKDSSIYWFERAKREDGSIDFIPHLIDDQSGVGTQVVAGDVDGDGDADLVIGNKRGTFYLRHREREVSLEESRRAQPRRLAAGLSPREAAEWMTVPEGFHVDLAAGEPDIHQPVAFSIDERGRLWVVEAHTYPRRAPEGQGKDLVLIFEDTDGDGSLDSRKVFTEGLNLVSGIEVGFGGVFIGAAPYLLFIPDRDHDDRPDGPPEVLLDGWGFHDTHETLNAFTWGPDGWLYGCQGIFTHSRVGKPGTPDAERTPLNACVWRFHPTRQDFEVFAEGSSNPWGLDFNDRGHAFITACVIPHLYHVIQGARYQRQAGRHFNPHTYDDVKTIADHLHHGGKLWTPDHNSLADQAGGGHAHCGGLIYLGDRFPDEYRGRLLMNNIHGNRVNVDILEPSGSGYIGRHGKDFLKAHDEWFRGINFRTAPDGSVYLIDWYDRQACHRNEPELWNRTNGRIYRIRHGAPEKVHVDVAALSDEELVELHLHRNDWYVRMARRTLQERGPSVRAHSALLKLLDRTDDVTRKLRVLWTLHATDGVTEPLALELLAHDDADIRAWTVQLSLERGEPSDRLLAALATASGEDASPVVRLYLASALGRLPLDARWSIASGLLSHAEDASDHNLPLVIWYGVEPLVVADTARALALASHSAIPRVERYIIRRAAAEIDHLDPLLAAVGVLPDDAKRELYLEEITRALREHARLEMPASWGPVYEALARSESETVRKHAEEIAVKFGDQRVFPALRALARDGEKPLAERLRALAVLVEGEDPDLVPVLISLLDEPGVRPAAIRGLAAHEDARIPEAILSRYARLGVEERANALQTLAARPSSAMALLGAVEAGRVDRKDIGAVTVRQLASLGDERIDTLLAEVWGSIRETSADKRAEMDRLRKWLTPEDLAIADLPHGRAVFQKTCATCHRLFGAGDSIAPDLTGSNRASVDYVLENVVDPNGVVGKDYELQVLVTRSGRVVSGLIESRSSTAITVRTVNDRVVVPVAEVVAERREPNSMMPEGLLTPLGKHEVRDLVAYLGATSQVPLRGREVSIDARSHVAAGVLEGESLKVLEVSAGGASPQTMSGFGVGKWSGNAQLWWTGGKPGARLELALPVARSGRYAVDVALTKAVDYGVVRFTLDGREVESAMDLFHRAVVPTGPLSLGEHDLEAGTHRLGVEIVGANPDAARAFMFGLDYVHLSEIE